MQAVAAAARKSGAAFCRQCVHIRCDSPVCCAVRVTDSRPHFGALRSQSRSQQEQESDDHGCRHQLMVLRSGAKACGDKPASAARRPPCCASLHSPSAAGHRADSRHLPDPICSAPLQLSNCQQTLPLTCMGTPCWCQYDDNTQAGPNRLHGQLPAVLPRLAAAIWQYLLAESTLLQRKIQRCPGATAAAPQRGAHNHQQLEAARLALAWLVGNHPCQAICLMCVHSGPC